MRRMKFVIAALCIGLVSAAVVSCEPKTTTPTVEKTAYEAVAGNYSGKMTCTTVEEPKGLVVGTEDASLEIKDREIIIASFPLTSVVKSIVGEETAPAIVEAIGNVEYKIGFTAAFNEGKTEADLALNPVELKLSLPQETREGEEPATQEIVVTFSTATNGKYVVETKKFTFALKIDKVTADNEVIEGFIPLLLEFDMTKK